MPATSHEPGVGGNRNLLDGAKSATAQENEAGYGWVGHLRMTSRISPTSGLLTLGVAIISPVTGGMRENGVGVAKTTKQ